MDLRHPGAAAAEAGGRSARQGRAGRRAPVAQRHGRGSQARRARARHRRDPRRAHARRRAGARGGGKDAGHQRRLERQVPRRPRPRRERRHDRRLPLSPAAGVRQPAAAGRGDGRLHRACARALSHAARREARRHRGPALPARHLQRHLGPAAARCADGSERRRDRLLAGFPLGQHAAAGGRDHLRAPDGPDCHHLSVFDAERAHGRRDQGDPGRRRRQPRSTPIPTCSRAATWCAWAA